jgi:hypothetical protein
MKNNEQFDEIIRIVRESDSLSAALKRIQSFLASAWGEALLIIRPASMASAVSLPAGISAFLESRNFPFRGMYTAPLQTGTLSHGTLVACIGTRGAPRETLCRVTNLVGQELTGLLRRLALPVLEYTEAA